MKYFFLVFLFIFGFLGCSNDKNKNEVVIYVSEDQVFSEPILKDFEKKTGIKVKALYDTEESKSTGVVNRLIAEKNNPQADVYWANEPIRAQMLKQRGLLSKYISKNSKEIADNFKDKDGFWCGFSARLRVLVADRNMKKYPSSVFDYLDEKYKDKAVIANPLFGSTTAQISAMFIKLGDKKAKLFLNGLKQNGVKISTSNGESADFIAKKRYLFSLVDSDDAVSRIRAGKDIKMIYPDQEEGGLGCFVIPNVVMLIKGAKHENNAKKLIDYLLSSEVEAKLALADCAQIPLHVEVKPPKELRALKDIKVMKVDYKDVAQKMHEIEPFLKEWAGY